MPWALQEGLKALKTASQAISNDNSAAGELVVREDLVMSYPITLVSVRLTSWSCSTRSKCMAWGTRGAMGSNTGAAHEQTDHGCRSECFCPAADVGALMTRKLIFVSNSRNLQVNMANRGMQSSRPSAVEHGWSI